MKPIEEHLNDRLEQEKWGIIRRESPSSGFIAPVIKNESDEEVDALLAIVHDLQTSPQLQPRPEFMMQLERRLIRRNVELRIQSRTKRRSFISWVYTRPALTAVLGICLIFVLLSSSMVALAAQVTDPTNPLYSLKRWGQQIQLQLTSNPADQASLDLQFARDRLNTIPSLANSADEGAYRLALSDFDQKITTASATIKGLSPGAKQAMLVDQLANLKLDAIHILRTQLVQLEVPEQLYTTAELARLGDTIPNVTQVLLTLPSKSTKNETISFLGSDLQPGAWLLINGKKRQQTGISQQGWLVFIVDSNGMQHPQSLGILNPDGSAMETSTITINTGSNDPSGDGQRGKGNKPPVIPTPHGNKPPVIPTPHGKKLPVTPTPHA
ncbi:MAG TPA: DUF5667 domain-containing protein [Ktedonobacteraceae bacterium]|nr:DUF5667 domain-containing protein [Ktedonobacteraceae bacterium]